jgi:hypothetical protein
MLNSARCLPQMLPLLHEGWVWRRTKYLKQWKRKCGRRIVSKSELIRVCFGFRRYVRIQGDVVTIFNSVMLGADKGKDIEAR